jgi:hypothetical protein
VLGRVGQVFRGDGDVHIPKIETSTKSLGSWWKSGAGSVEKSSTI